MSCGVVDKQVSSVYFAGEIVNPTTEYVVLYKDDQVIDSAKLDARNRFNIRFNNASEGLYHFDHSPQFHYVYLEKGDSLNLRLNTIEFDESIVFSGKGAEINNFIVELFLANEEDESIVEQYFPLEPKVFNKKIEQLRKEKIRLLEELLEEVSLSDRATELLKATIDYNAFIYKEKYPFYHRATTHENRLHKLPNNFYDYRKELSLNNRDLIYFRPYYNFMKYHLGNLAYMECEKSCKDVLNTSSAVHFNEHKLKLTEALVQEKKLKDNLYRNIVMHYLLKVKDSPENTNLFMNTFYAYSPNNRHMGEITKLHKDIQELQPQKKLPRIELLNTNGMGVRLNEIALEKSAVFYFWSGRYQKHLNRTLAQISELEKQYPNYSFIGINRNTEYNEWLKIIREKGLNPKNQFRSENFEELKNTLVIDHLNKSIVTHKGLITNGFADLYSLRLK
jgi:hypothetical protein